MTRAEKLAKIAENEPKVYEAGQMSIIKTEARGDSTLTGCLDEPIISLSIVAGGALSFQVAFTSESGETQTVEYTSSAGINELVYDGNKIILYELTGEIDKTDDILGKQIKALHTYAGTTYVTGAYSVGYYKDVRQAQYEAGEKVGKASETAKIAYNFKRSKEAVLMRGGEIDMSAEIDALPSAILNIPLDASIGFSGNSETAYQKIVPEGAEDYAMLKSLGGMTYKCNNLIPFPYVVGTQEMDGTEGKNEKDYAGIKYTFNSDGSIKLFGTSTGGTLFITNRFFLPSNVDVCLSGGAVQTNGSVSLVLKKLKSDGSNDYDNFLTANITPNQKQITESGTIYGMGIYMQAGTEVDCTIYPMLNYGTEAKPFEPYYEGLRDTKVTEIVSRGRNLLPYPYADGNYKEENGLTFTVNGDGTIMVDGTAEKSTSFYLQRRDTFTLPNGIYSISGLPTIETTAGEKYYLAAGLYNNNVWETEIGDYYGKGTTKDVTNIYYTGVNVVLTIKAGTSCDQLVFKPMLNAGTAVLPYEPYQAPKFTTIPTEIQELDGYGLGLNDEIYNYVDYTEKKFYRNVYAVDLGALSWKQQIAQSESLFLAMLPISGKPTGSFKVAGKELCSNYDTITHDAAYYCEAIGIALQATVGDKVYVYDTAYTDAKTLKEALSGVILCYELAEPIIEDISDKLADFDNFIKVEGGGLIEFVNEHSNAVPSTVEYVAPIPAEEGDD